MKRIEFALFFLATVAALLLPALPALQAWHGEPVVQQAARPAPAAARISVSAASTPEQVAVR